MESNNISPCGRNKGITETPYPKFSVMFWIEGYATFPKTVVPMPTYTHTHTRRQWRFSWSCLQLTLSPNPHIMTPTHCDVSMMTRLASSHTATPLGWVTGCYIICSLNPPSLSATPSLSLDELVSSQEAPCAAHSLLLLQHQGLRLLCPLLRIHDSTFSTFSRCFIPMSLSPWDFAAHLT